jgi:hypothetical protein
MQGKDTGPKFPTAVVEIEGKTLTAVFNAGTIEAIEEACGRSCFDLFDEMIVLARSDGTVTTQVTSLRTARRLVAGAFRLGLDEGGANFVDDVVPMDCLLTTYMSLVKPFTQAVVRIMKPVSDVEDEKASKEKASAEANPPSSDASASGPA